MPPYQVLILTDKEDRDFRNSAELHFSQANIDTATAPAEPVDALLLPGENIDRPLHQLRSGQWHWPADIPAFTLGKAHPLADGDYTQLSEQLANWLTQYQQRRAQLAQLPEAIAPLERFLQYAWPRPGFTLRAQWQLSQHSNYHYPILRALGLDDEQRLLQQWQQQEVLESTELLDRVRQCPHCHSEQINFVDTCPSCKSIDIHSTIALHCFTCGHVGEQRQFQQDNALRCPTCLTQLRHIGVDYDRPLERFACNSCQQRFIEGEVVGRCPNGHASNPSELLERRIYHYRLGPGADQFASSGRVFDNRALQWGESVSLENFSWLLRWNNASARRHRHQHLLLFLNWAGIGQAIAQLGEQQCQQQIQELQRRLQSVVRQTDIFTELEDDKALLLLTHCSPKWAERISEKIRSIESSNSSSLLKLNIRSYALPDKKLPDDTQQWLLDNAGQTEFANVG